jgi:phosphatidylglycerophosphate synthase
MPKDFQAATRVISSVLAPLEQRCLSWLAQRMPRWVHADHLTALAAAAMFLAGLSYWLARVEPLALWLVVIWLAVNWFGDSLDGTIARVRNQQRPRYGFYVDHIVDCFSTLFLFSGLALSGYMSPPVAIGLLIVYLLLSAEVYLATYCLHTFRITHWGFGPTELRILLSMGNIAVFFRPTTTVFGRETLVFDVGGIIGLIGLAVTLLYSTVTNTCALYRAEPRPQGDAL